MKLKLMHALAFRVMRLCKPSLQVDTQTRLDLALDLLSDADAVAAIARGVLQPDRPSDRTTLSDSLDAFGEPCSHTPTSGHSRH